MTISIFFYLGSIMKLLDWQKRENIKTLIELAEKLGVTDTSNPSRLVHRWLNGESIPRKKQLEKIKEATNGQVTPNDFFS